MVAHFGSLNRLFSASLADFSALDGLGPAKFAQLQAVLELARRALAEQLQDGALLDSPQAVKHYLQLLLARKPHESFAVLFLDVKNRLIAAEELFRGTLDPYQRLSARSRQGRARGTMPPASCWRTTIRPARRSRARPTTR